MHHGILCLIPIRNLHPLLQLLANMARSPCHSEWLARTSRKMRSPGLLPLPPTRTLNPTRAVRHRTRAQWEECGILRGRPRYFRGPATSQRWPRQGPLTLGAAWCPLQPLGQGLQHGAAYRCAARPRQAPALVTSHSEGPVAVGGRWGQGNKFPRYREDRARPAAKAGSSPSVGHVCPSGRPETRTCLLPPHGGRSACVIGRTARGHSTLGTHV